MEFSDRKRTNPNRRKIEIVQQEGSVMIADITEEPGNVTQEGTPITATIMTQISQQAETAVNVAGRVTTLETNLNKIYNSQNDKITANLIEINNTVSTKVGIELGRKDGVANTPYIDFHTDGKSSTDYNVRMLASGSELKLTASNLKLNEKILDVIEDQGTGYIKYANGIQICWGKNVDTTNINYQKTYTANFNPFKDTTYTVIATPLCTRSDNPYMYALINVKTATMTTSSAELYVAPTNNSSWINGCMWLIIGKWK